MLSVISVRKRFECQVNAMLFGLVDKITTYIEDKIPFQQIIDVFLIEQIKN